MKQVPVCIFNGMLESGKTTMVRTLLENPKLTNGRKIIILVCEEGMEEYDEEELKKKNVYIRLLEDETLFTDVLFRRLNKEEKPDYVIVEYNGMWDPTRPFLVEYPKGWEIAEAMTTVDSSTFRLYQQNMRPMMAAMYRVSDMVVFNRFNDDYDKISCRSVVKAQNITAQVVFEYEDGTIDMNFDASPFDLSGDTVEIGDTDWGLWYFDAMESVSKYAGKDLTALVRVAHFDRRDGKKGLILGRIGMTCCEADQQFLGIICNADEDLPDDSYVRIRAKVLAVDGRMYGEDPEPYLPILQLVSWEEAETPETEVVAL